MATRWYQDPKLARTLGRFSWVVLVAAFVLLTRFDVGAREPLALAGVVALIGVMNAPIVYGLVVSQRESTTRAYRAVALMLLLRIAATAFVAWTVSQK